MLYYMLCFTLAPGSDPILPKLENIPQDNDTCIEIYEHKHVRRYNLVPLGSVC